MNKVDLSQVMDLIVQNTEGIEYMVFVPFALFILIAGPAYLYYKWKERKQKFDF